ncbi:MAG: stage II sporulation protein M [Saprospirales bacterium]|jgi:uncharacterized membrane protein SpoIIM required for sporulation|nr:stage II sporulation protein M [Saprospirales bacterium]
MRETKFIEQNQEKWADFEEMLRHNHRDPEKLNDLFIQITDDLSYARTFYPNRSVRMYLNNLAQRIFHHVYRGKRFPVRRFRLFWTEELPWLLWDARRALFLSFCIFAAAALIGVISSRNNPDFARAILGEEYVNMTLENIRLGDPMAVYKESRPLGMSVGIAANNLFVALRTAVFGVLAAIGTVFMLVYNGVMLGAFQYFFAEKGLLWESFLTIWIHGTLEISAIIVAGAAGLVAGSGLLFPGTYTRGQAFQLSMRRGLKIFIGLVPVFVLAAFFEGFLTRFTDTPAPLRLLFILCSLAFVFWYFVWFPYHRSRTGRPPLLQEKELPATRAHAVSFTSIKNAGELFSDTFTLFRRYLRVCLAALVLASAVFAGAAYAAALAGQSMVFVFPDHLGGAFTGWWDAIGRNRAPVMFWTQMALLWGLFWVALYIIRREMPAEYRDQWRIPVFGAQLLVPLALSFGTVWLLENLPYGLVFWLAGIVLFPFAGLWIAVAAFENTAGLSLPRAWQLMRWEQGVVLGFIVINFALLLFLFLDSGVWTMVIRFLSWMAPADEASMQAFVTYTTAFFASMIAHFVWLFFLAAGMLLYFSSRELTDAPTLRAGIAQVGRGRQIRGLAKE